MPISLMYPLYWSQCSNDSIMHTPKAVPLESTRLRPPRLQPLVPDPRVVNPDVAHQLRAELSHKIFRDFPVTKFIQCIYRYNPSDIPRSDKPYSIGHKLRRGYHGVTTRVLPFGSQEMILGTFDRIIRDLTKQVIKASGKPDRIKTLMDYSKEEWDHLGFFGFFQKTNLISRVQMEKIDLTRFAEVIYIQYFVMSVLSYSVIQERNDTPSEETKNQSSVFTEATNPSCAPLCAKPRYAH